jgi:hypothetical protein
MPIKSRALRLSKSKVMLGLQCSKALYLSKHQPELAGEVSDSQQMIFDQGHAVGILAQSHFPGGVLVDAPHTDSELALKQTAAAIDSGALAIYEATLLHDDILVKVDILHRKNIKASWQIVEVKSSTQVKEVHIPDSAIQTWVCRGAGLKVTSASVMTINNKCIFPDLADLFTVTDVTIEAELALPGILKQVAQFKKMLVGKSAPKTDIGPQCDDPYPCAFKDHCWSSCKIPDISIFDIPRLASKTKWELYRSGLSDLKRLDTKDFNSAQARMIEHTVAKTRFVDKMNISKSIKNWQYPMSFLDFESIAYAIPRYDGQRPYQQLPFQFSCHIKTKPSAKVTHAEYLHTLDTDPRKAIAEALVEVVPASGSVVAYNMSFERLVLKALAEEFPRFKKSLLSIAERLVDPLPIIRSHVYDPGFRGSFSIKTVAPAILGQAASYDGMFVGDGVDAQSAYLEMLDSKTTTDNKEKLRKNLIAYCSKDTMSMVQLVEWLYLLK